MIYPPDFKNRAYKATVADQAAMSIAGLAMQRRAVVQAGGCSGLWPIALAPHFETVYTFEPAPSNFKCLVQNVAHLPNVHASDYALADVRGRAGLTRPKVGAGLWRLEGDGDVEVMTIDSLFADLPVDAIVLDVEGAEASVFRGAKQVITAQRPLLWFEYLRNRAAIDGFLAAHDYTPPARGIDGDYYSLHRSQVQ